jgi:hypothetical protein
MFKPIALALCAVFVLTSAPALADDKRGHRGGDGYWKQQQHHGKHHKARGKGRHGHGKAVVVWHGPRHWSPPPKRQVHRHVHVHKHRHKQVHRHHVYKKRDRDDWAIYAILALQVVELLNDNQRNGYAWAHERAVAAPLGDSIRWNDGSAYGSVTAVRDGRDSGGRYCREFQHEIVVGNRQQSGYGTACRQPDGDWEIVS